MKSFPYPTVKLFAFIFCLIGLTRCLQLDSQLASERTVNRERRQTSSTESSSYFFYQQPDYPRDCREAFEQCDGDSTGGVYLIQPDGYLEPFAAYCDNTVDGGNWMVIQRRMDGSVDFNRVWEDYKEGFGFLNREFWLGNEKLAYITNQKDYELRIDFVSKSDDPYFAKYNLFRISDEGTKYKLVALGDFDTSSTVQDKLSCSRGMAFSTRDRDNDLSSSYHCADASTNGWWFGGSSRGSCYSGDGSCHGYGAGPNYPWSSGPYWNSFPGGNHNIKYIEMKIRPL